LGEVLTGIVSSRGSIYWHKALLVDSGFFDVVLDLGVSVLVIGPLGLLYADLPLLAWGLVIFGNNLGLVVLGHSSVPGAVISFSFFLYSKFPASLFYFRISLGSRVPNPLISLISIQIEGIRFVGLEYTENWGAIR
jgi:hypothetical protein